MKILEGELNNFKLQSDKNTKSKPIKESLLWIKTSPMQPEKMMN